MIACRCLNSAQLAGPRSPSDLVSIPVACGTRGPFSGDSWAAGREFSVSGLPDWGTPLLLSPAADIRAPAPRCPRTRGVGRCRRQALFYALFSAVTQPQHGGPLLPQVPLGDPKSFRQSQQSLGKDCCWLSPGRLLGFPKRNCAIPQGTSGLLKAGSPPLVSLIPVTIHSVGQVPGLRATLDSSLSLTCASFSPTMALFKVCWEDVCFSPSPQSPCLTTTSTGPSYPHTCSPVIRPFHRCQERFFPSVYCSATNI